jgi:hypothetical protein
LNWQESDLAALLRSDPCKLAIAARLGNETTLAIKWIAARVQMGTPKGAKALLLRLASGKAGEAQRTMRTTAIPIYGLTPSLPEW